MKPGKARLPAWVVDDPASLREESAPYLAMSVADRAAVLDAVCRDAVDLAAARPDADAVRAWRDPIPASTEAHLRRLRDAARR